MNSPTFTWRVHGEAEKSDINFMAAHHPGQLLLFMILPMLQELFSVPWKIFNPVKVMIASFEDSLLSAPRPLIIFCMPFWLSSTGKLPLSTSPSNGGILAG